MAGTKALTGQTNNRRYLYNDLTRSPLMIGGLTGIRAALMAYSPIETGYARLFMVRKPLFVTTYFDKTNDNAFEVFKHILEYGFTEVSGINADTLQTADFAGGHVNRAIAMPTVQQNDTNEVTISVYEFIGSPVREVLEIWIGGISDRHTGYVHYQGEVSVHDGDMRLDYNESNHTAEFIYVVTDKTGFRPEFACMLTHAFPVTVPLDTLAGYSAGSHDLVKYNIAFKCIMERSIVINTLATDLLNAYPVVTNNLNFNPRAGDAIYTSSGSINEGNLGKPLQGVKTITPVGTTPVDDALYTPVRAPEAAKYGPTKNPKNATMTQDLMEVETVRGHGQSNPPLPTIGEF